MSNVHAERHRAAVSRTVFRVVTAQSNELLADGTAGVDSLLTHLRMLDDSLHLVAAHAATIGISALTGMDQRLDATLNALVTISAASLSTGISNK